MKTVKESSRRIRHLITAVLFLMTTGQTLRAASKKMKSDDLSNMIIEGDNRLHVRAKSPEPTWTPDVYKEVGLAMGGESLMLGFRTPAVTEPPLSFPKTLSSRKTATPWLSTILDTPVLSLHTKPVKETKKMEWVFLVKNYEGNEIYRVKKEGLMPELIPWEGFDSAGKPLMVGFDYNYSLSMIDEAGNPQHHPGEPFRVDAFRYGSAGKQTIAITPSVLFTGESELKFSANGLNLLTEVKDSLRGRSDAHIDVTVYDDDTKFGLSRAQAIGAYLTKELEGAPSKIASKSAPLKQGQGYRHVDIVTK